MVPTRLTATNFLSYASLDLDLSGLHAACIAGTNGAGKSSLVDALLYAWCGVGRYKLLDQYVRLGADRMSLTLEWLMGQQRYRVIRRRSIAGRSKSEADVHCMGADGEWRGVASGEGVTAAITGILGLDYETLVSSAICRQGDASRFTQATAGQRKAILRSIFRLGDYEALAKVARDLAAKEQGRSEALEPERLRLQQLASRRPETARLCDAALEDTTRSASALERTQGRLATVRETIVALQAKIDQRQQREAEQAQLQTLAEDAASRLASTIIQLATATEQATKRAELQQLVQQADECAEQIRQATMDAHARETDVREARQAESTAEVRLRELTVQIAAMDAKQREWADLLARADEVEAAKAEVFNLDMRLASGEEDHRRQMAAQHELEAEITALDRREAERTHLTAQLEATRSRCADQVEFATRTAAQQQARAAVIETVPCAGVERADGPLGASCPLLKEAWEARRSSEQDQTRLAAARQTLLDPDPAMRISIEELTATLAGTDRASLETSRQHSLESIAVLEAAITDHKAAMKRLQPIAQLAGTIKLARAEAIRHVAERHARQSERDAQDAALAELRLITHAATQRWRDAHNYLSGLQRAAATLGEHRPALDHAKIAEASLPALSRRIEELTADLSRHTLRRQEIDAHLAALGHSDQERTDRSMERDRLESEITTLQDRFHASTRRHAETQAQLDQIAAAETRLAEISPVIDSARLLSRRYEHLLTAYKTVPVLVLENVIPAIETEANALLGRISSSGLQVRLETLKAVKSKDTLSEDLDIIVRDRAGERPIEGYSGGETFRVAFALRIALSRIIAQRSGVGLDFLVIDEGFGALDAEGLAMLLEAIQRVKGDFGMILVVSHLDTVLEGFASRILVTKDGNGSTAEVNV